MNRRSLTDRVVWLTGASTGIGAALVPVLAEAGCRVAMTARREEKLQELAKPLTDAGKEVLVVAGDVTERETVRQVVSTILQTWGRIDIAIFNAGGSFSTEVPQLDATAVEQTFRLNFLSMVYGIEAVLSGMLERGDGYLVGVASLAGYRGLAEAPAYGASKAAMIHFLESVRFGLEPLGIDVSIVNPGFVRTPLTDRNRFQMPFLLEAPDAADRIVRGLRRRRREIHFPRRMSWIMKTMRVLPFSLYYRLTKAMVPRPRE